MQCRLRLPVVIVAGATVLALAVPATASASRTNHGPGASVVASSGIMNTSTKRHPFHVKPGHIFDVIATLHGVRRGDRLALQSFYRKHRHHPRSPKRWHKVGSWRLHAGERHFRGATYGAYPGLFTLRVKFLRHHRLLRGSQSNRFYVKVRRFHLKKLHKPKHHKPHSVAGLHGLAVPQKGVINDWTSVSCASIEGGLGGGGVDVIPPFRKLTNGVPINVYQVSFYSNFTNGSWGAWHVGNALPQTVEVPGTDPDTINIAEGSGEGSTPDELGTTAPLDFFGQEGFHTIGWDFQIQSPSTGQWVWAFQNLQIPGAYQQYDQNGNFVGQSSTCQTFHGEGFGPRR